MEDVRPRAGHADNRRGRTCFIRVAGETC